jgi:hypothetical protein
VASAKLMNLIERGEDEKSKKGLQQILKSIYEIMVYQHPAFMNLEGRGELLAEFIIVFYNRIVFYNTKGNQWHIGKVRSNVRYIIQRMIEEGADPHSEAVLRAAVNSGDPNLLEMLLRSKGRADPNSRKKKIEKRHFTSFNDALNDMYRYKRNWFVEGEDMAHVAEDMARLLIAYGLGPSINSILKQPDKYAPYKKILDNSAKKIQAAVRGQPLRRHTDPITLDNIPYHREFTLNKQVYNTHSLANYLKRTKNASPRVPHSRRPLTLNEKRDIRRKARNTGWK